MPKSFVFLLCGVSLFLIGLLSCVTAEVKETLRIPASKSVDGPDPSYDQIVKILSQTRPETIEAFLEELKKVFPDYLKYHTLAYGSLSLHESSPLNPRAIVFGNSARLLISFNGEPSQKGYSNLEIMTFRPEQGFEFREIHFLTERNSETLIPQKEFELNLPTVQISKANPTTCLTCHGPKIPRPNWQPYPTWPGFYGSIADHAVSTSLFASEYPSNSVYSDGHGFKLLRIPEDKENPYEPAKNDFELRNFRGYLVKKNGVGRRYRFLPDFPQGYELGNSTIVDFNSYQSSYDKPNQSLTLALSSLRDEWLFRDIMARHPSNWHLTAMLVSLCDPHQQADQIEGLAAKIISQFAHQNSGLKNIFENEDRFFSDIEFEALNVHFQKKLRRDKSQYSSISRGNYNLAHVLGMIGLKLSDYSMNSERSNIYDTGSQYDFARLKNLSLAEAERRHILIGGKIIKKCPDLGFQPDNQYD